MKENWEIYWKDYYKILQIHPLAEPEVVKAAYDRLARKYHPDVNDNQTALARMKDLNEAFEIINSPIKRTRYDKVYSSINNAPTSKTQSGVPSNPIHASYYDDSWEHLFIPLSSDTIYQKQQKVVNAIEYVLKVLKPGWLDRGTLRSELKDAKATTGAYGKLDENDIRRQLLFTIERLDKYCKAWRKLFVRDSETGYYTTNNKK